MSGQCARCFFVVAKYFADTFLDLAILTHLVHHATFTRTLDGWGQILLLPTCFSRVGRINWVGQYQVHY